MRLIHSIRRNFQQAGLLTLAIISVSACDSGAITDAAPEADSLPLDPISFAKAGSLEALEVRASSHLNNYIVQNTIDGDLSAESRWTSEGEGEWVRYNLENVEKISSVDIAFHLGVNRTYSLTIEVSKDASDWVKVFSGSSSQQTNDFENFEFDDIDGQYVRITGFGNSSNELNSYTEVAINTVEAGDSPVNSFSLPGRIQAEDYHRYYDTTPGNSAGGYREDDVDIKSLNGRPHVTNIQKGEWLEYDIELSTSGPHSFVARAKKSSLNAANVVVEINGQRETVPITSKEWASAKVGLGDLPAGSHTIRVEFEDGLFFNWFEVQPMSEVDDSTADAQPQTPQMSPPVPNPVSTPAAENDQNLRPGDPGVRIDTSKFDPAYPQMKEWAKAGVRGGIPFINKIPVKKTINGGSSDDINAAINAVAKSGGGAVMLSNGKYRINKQVTMKKGVSLIGQSRSGVVAEISMNKGNGFLFGRGVTNSGLYRMTIQGGWGRPKQNWNIGQTSPNNELPGNENVSIMIKDTTDCWVDGVDILNSGDFPIRVNAKHITMRDLYVDGVHNKHGGAHGYFFILDGYNLLTQSKITHLRHLSLQGDGVEYNVLYDNDFRQEISFHSGDDGNNLIENNRITLPADMPPANKKGARPDYRAIMGPWSSKHRNSARPNFIWNNHNVQNNHGGRIVLSGRNKIYHGPLVTNTKGQAAEDNWKATDKLPKHGTLYPIVLDKK